MCYPNCLRFWPQCEPFSPHTLCFCYIGIHVHTCIKVYSVKSKWTVIMLFAKYVSQTPLVYKIPTKCYWFNVRIYLHIPWVVVELLHVQSGLHNTYMYSWREMHTSMHWPSSHCWLLLWDWWRWNLRMWRPSALSVQWPTLMATTWAQRGLMWDTMRAKLYVVKIQ